MSLTPIYVSWETADGTVCGPIRVIAVDRIAAESTCRRQAWELVDGPLTHSLMTFYAARRAGLTDADDYDTFMATVTDFTLSNTITDEQVNPTPARKPKAAG